MSEVTRLLEAAAGGEPRAAAELLPLVHAECVSKRLTSLITTETAGGFEGTISVPGR